MVEGAAGLPAADLDGAVELVLHILRRELRIADLDRGVGAERGDVRDVGERKGRERQKDNDENAQAFQTAAYLLQHEFTS